MSSQKRIHSRGFSLTPTLFLMIDHCLASPLLLPRDQGTAVLSADSADSATVAQPIKTNTPHTNPNQKSPTMIILFVALASLALTIPMFVYIWIRRRRLHAMRAQSREQQQAEYKDEFSNGSMRKGSIASTVEMPLTAAKPVGRVRKESVTFAQPIQISVKPIRAVEITVKPTRTTFRDPSWEKLKS